MDIRELDLDSKMLVAKVLESLQQARQIAYDAALEMPELRAAYEAAEAAYYNTALQFNAPYRDVFDKQAHIEDRLAHGDLYHTFASENGFYARKP